MLLQNILKILRVSGLPIRRNLSAFLKNTLIYEQSEYVDYLKLKNTLQRKGKRQCLSSERNIFWTSSNSE